jgi:hypothetical protein
MDNDDLFFEEISDTENDIDATVEALREAWKCVPGVSLSALLDMVASAPFMELSNQEFISELNEFIMQNQ